MNIREMAGMWDQMRERARLCEQKRETRLIFILLTLGFRRKSEFPQK